MKRLHLLAILEANTATGPAKNLLQFASTEARPDGQADVSIAVFHRAGDPEVLAEAAAKVRVPFYRIEEQGRFDRSVVPALQILVRRIQPDVVQTHAAKSHAIVRAAGLHRMAPWVAFHHGYTWTDWRARLYAQADRWSLRSARQVVTVSEPFRRELERIGVKRERIVVLHNAIPADWGRIVDPLLRARLGIADGKPIVLMVGRLSLEKDHLTLLEAVARVHRSGRAAPHLLIVGQGPEQPRIAARAEALSLAAHVTFTGQVDSAEPYYAISDVAVLSSRTEGSPNALLEAMAAGIAAVATAVGGIPEIVTGRESALLVSPGDAQAMADALIEVLTDRALAESLAAQAYALVKSSFSPEARAARLREIYRALIETAD